MGGLFMSNCKEALVRDVHSMSLDSAQAFAMHKVLQSSFTSDERSKLDATIPINGVPVAFNSERASKLANHFFSQTGLQWNEQTSIDLLSQTLSSNAVEAYRTCINGQHTSGPRAVAYDATPEQIIVQVVWFSAAGADTEADATYTIAGGTTQDKLPKEWITGERRRFLFKRTKGEDFTFIVNIGNDADHIFAPNLPRVIVETRKEIVMEPRSLANDGSGRNQLINDIIHAPDGAEIDPSGSGVEVTTKVGNLDHTTFARIDEANTALIRWSAFLRPLSRQGGGTFVFRIKYPLIHYNFRVV
jgi:hypothetical protein